jgi:hypothetical protein
MDLGALARRLESVSPWAPAQELRELTEQIVAAWRDARQAIRDFVATPEAVT